MATPNYRVTLSYDPERKVFSARAPELAHCSGEGATRAEAVARLEEEIAAQIANMHAHGSNPPAPVDEVAVTGELTANVSQGLHRELMWIARSEGVELNQLVGELLSASIESRKQGAGQRARGGNQRQDGPPQDNIGNSVGNERNGNSRGPNRGGYGPRYNPVMDDRANFIEYVRGLEGGQGQPRGGGDAGGANRRRRRSGGGNPRMPGGGSPGGGGNGGNGPKR